MGVEYGDKGTEAYDPEKDEVLIDMGELPDTKIKVALCRYNNGLARVRVTTQGSKGRHYPVRVLSAAEALLFADKVLEYAKQIEKVAREDAKKAEKPKKGDKGGK